MKIIEDDYGNAKTMYLTGEELATAYQAGVFRGLLGMMSREEFVDFLNNNYEGLDGSRYADEAGFPADQSCWIWELLGDIAECNGNHDDRYILDCMKTVELKYGVLFEFSAKKSNEMKVASLMAYGDLGEV